MSQDALARKLSGTWRISLEAAVTSLVPNLAIRAVAFGRGSEMFYLAAKTNVELTEGLLFRGEKNLTRKPKMHQSFVAFSVDRWL